MIYRCILPDWARAQNLPVVQEGEFSDKTLLELNEQFYNIYYYPNYPRVYFEGEPVNGSHVDVFEWVFVDMDLKDGVYASKESFLERLKLFALPASKIIDSGNGVHAYWRITDLDSTAFLRFQRRLARLFKTDLAVSKLAQLMRVSGFCNTKLEDSFSLCKEIAVEDVKYSCEQIDNALPIISLEDEKYCVEHFERTHTLDTPGVKVDTVLPLKFADLLKNNKEVAEIWSAKKIDRSKADFKLGNILWSNGFTKEEAISVLINTDKAASRSKAHRINYAKNIVDKVWAYEKGTLKLGLSKSVKEILLASGDNLKGKRFACHKWIDDTAYGFRLGQVIGLIAGSGVGKTAVALNLFKGFVQSNPGCVHFFIPLEQTQNEIADRWKTLCGTNETLFDRVHVISNYDENGAFRNLSLEEIKQYLLWFQKTNNQPVGCVVIDHIGALKKKGKDGETQGLMDICHSMKAFAIETNTMLVMQSQAPREKAGIGDLELNKDAAYGTVYFESYCDYLITIWQPLKRCYAEGAPTVTAFKFCKIRHKKQGIDVIQEDVAYRMYFDPLTGELRGLTQKQEQSFDFFNQQAINKRKEDRKTDVIPYQSIKDDTHGSVDADQDEGRALLAH